MDGYHIALFIHFTALIAAIGASAIIHLATTRRDRAKTVGEMLEWHNVVLPASKVFPFALLVLVLSGSYMVSKSGLNWSSGFVVGGLTGVVLLFVMGMVLGMKGRALRDRLESLVRDGAGNPRPAMPRDSVATLLQNVPVGIVVAMVFDMTTKPTLASGLVVLGLGIALGAVAGLLHRPAPAASPATENEG